MAKSQKNQTFVLKINTGYLKKHNWNITLRLSEIRKQPQMVVSLGSSQILRWLTAESDNDIKATEIKKRIRWLKKQGNSSENKRSVANAYNELYKLQFQQDYMMLVMDSAKDYKYVCKHGFIISIDYGDGKIHTVKYERFLGTAGSIKKSTIIFVNAEIHDWLMAKIENGRYQGPAEGETVKTYNGKELNYKFIPAKLNAYYALQCSASIQVPWPRIAVINDVETTFKTIIKEVRDEEGEDFPTVSDDVETEITINACDGMGFISPQMSTVWAEALNEGTEPLSGYNVRCSYLKGMVFTMDFVKFAEDVVGTYYFKDAWGDVQDVREIDVILTVSMLKLWNSYAGCQDYYDNCMCNGYDFCVAKTTPHELRNMHTTNYQYLQDFKFNDTQVADLIQPTVAKIQECLGLDWRKLILYMCGVNLNEETVLQTDPMSRAIMANPLLVNDPYVRSKVSRMIQKRIRTAKIGVLDVAGDYAIIGCDPYLLLQNMFGLEPTGLLKTGQCYHKYWADRDVQEIIAFRAPMTSHENVCKLSVVNDEAVNDWFKYIKTCCILNGWDTTPIRCNGADYDSDTFFTTNNSVLLESFEYKTTLMCFQESMPKKIPTRDDYIISDINGFGDSIGSVTNKATNMISLREQFEPDSEEYKRLTYRISTMMHYQQNAIDRIKGVVAKPIPNEWLEPKLFKINEDDSAEVAREKTINANIAAKKKPYFFMYRYSQLKAEFDKYIKSVNLNCKIRFGTSLNDLYAKPDKSEEENEFLNNYEKYMPLSKAPGTMNRICWKIEEAFASTNVLPNVDFDYSILKSDASYTFEEYSAVKDIYDEYNKSLQLFLKQGRKNDMSKEERNDFMIILNQAFQEACCAVCPDEEVLANIVVDICYQNNSSKAFAWNVAGEQIFKNISNGTITYPVMDVNGDIEFYGEKFSLHTQVIGGDINVNSE